MCGICIYIHIFWKYICIYIYIKNVHEHIYIYIYYIYFWVNRVWCMSDTCLLHVWYICGTLLLHGCYVLSCVVTFCYIFNIKSNAHGRHFEPRRIAFSMQQGTCTAKQLACEYSPYTYIYIYIHHIYVRIYIYRIYIYMYIYFRVLYVYVYINQLYIYTCTRVCIFCYMLFTCLSHSCYICGIAWYMFATFLYVFATMLLHFCYSFVIKSSAHESRFKPQKIQERVCK